MGSTVWLMLGMLLGCGGGIRLERYIHGEGQQPHLIGHAARIRRSNIIIHLGTDTPAAKARQDRASLANLTALVG
jgi:hypothetical protein